MKHRHLLGALAAAASAAALAMPATAIAASPTPSPSASGGGGGGEETTLGNNLSMPLVFAEGIGVGGVTVPTGWTAEQSTKSDATDWTGLRGYTPLATDGLTTASTDYPGYYLQGTENYWRADYEWTNSSTGPVQATAAWGDNLAQTWKVNQPVRVEVGLTRPLPTDGTIPATNNGFAMTNLTPAEEGSTGHTTETWATDGKLYSYTTEAVYTRYATLTITDPSGQSVSYKTADAAEGSGFAAEVNAGGSVVYGYNWKPAATGTYKLTFSIDSGGNVTLDNSICNNSVVKYVTVSDTSGGGSTGEGETTVTAPGAPTNLKVSGSGTQLSATWSAPTSDGGSAITGYNVCVTPADSAMQTVTGNSATIGGVKFGTNYTVSVSANNAAGTSLPATATGMLPQNATAVTGTDHALYLRTTPGSKWYNFGGYLVDPPAEAHSSTNGATYFVARSSNNLLYVRTTRTGWTRLSSTVNGCTQPSAEVVGSTLVIACRSTSGSLFTLSAPITGSSNPVVTKFTNLGGALSAGPAVVYINGTLYYVVPGPVWNSHGDNLWVRTPSTGFTHYAQGLNCARGAAPSANYHPSTGELYVGCNQAGTTQFIYRYQRGSSSAVVAAGGRTIGQSGVAVSANGTATAFVEGTDRQVYYKVLRGKTPSLSWGTLGGQVLNGADADQIFG